MRDAILDRWAAGETETAIVAALHVDVKAVRNAIERARYHKDPRGVRHGHDHGTKYTDEQIATVKRLWTGGHPSSHIARALHVTRNVVIGLVYRLGLPKRAQRPLQPRAEPMRQQPSRKPVTLTKPAPKAPARPPLPAITVRAPLIFRAPQPPSEPVSRNLPLTEWTAATCKWIAGEGPAGPACGHPTYQGRPWCEHHARRAYA